MIEPPEPGEWPDLLYTWMSERGNGSLSSLTTSYQWLRQQADPRWKQTNISWAVSGYLRALSVLGMAEVDRVGSQRWSVAPPVVSVLPGSDLGVLTGSRTAAMLECLERASGDGDRVDVRVVAQARAPRAVLLGPQHQNALGELAAELGASFPGCAARQLAARLPALDGALGEQTWAPDPAGASLQVFNPKTLEFADLRGCPDGGLVQADSYGRTRFLLGQDGTWHEVPREAGIYRALAHAGRSVLRWTAQRGGELRVPQKAPLPVLHARSAALCFGTLPALEDGLTLVYRNVPHDVASAVCETLWQPVPQPEGTARAR